MMLVGFFFSSRRRHTRSDRDWSSDVCSSDLVTNSLSQDPASAIQLAHPMVKDSAEVQNLSTLPDRRFLAKVTDRKSATATVPDTFSLACLKSALAWIRYPTPNSAIPMIRNEELFLLRAQAYWVRATVSKAPAVNDLNFIRQIPGDFVPRRVTI